MWKRGGITCEKVREGVGQAALSNSSLSLDMNGVS